MEQSPPSEMNTRSGSQEIPHLKEGSLLYSQEPITEPHSEPGEYSPQLHTLFLHQF